LSRLFKPGAGLDDLFASMTKKLGSNTLTLVGQGESGHDHVSISQ